MDRESAALWVAIISGILSIVLDAVLILRVFLRWLRRHLQKRAPNVPFFLVYYNMTYRFKIILACFCVLMLIRAIRRFK